MAKAASWAELRAKAVTVPKRSASFYDRVILGFASAGFRLADAEMETAFEALGNYAGNRESTYPAIRQTTPNRFGLYAYGTHDRSERVEEAIDTLASLHADDIAAGKAWLMPVLDDDEYVSFEFDVVVGTRDEVLAILRAAKPLAQGIFQD